MNKQHLTWTQIEDLAIRLADRLPTRYEVMLVIKRIGGMEKIKLAFFADNYEGAKTSKEQPWSFWRLEGPGIVWNFRVLPHVHTYVNIAVRG